MTTTANTPSADLARHLADLFPMQAAPPLIDLAASRYAAETGTITAWTPARPGDQPPF